ncbi:MAG: hypothetical protein JW827_04195 [Spirochaetes bacterium]|nr:hypothetical protein [Spirochaetota bacterium]
MKVLLLIISLFSHQLFAGYSRGNFEIEKFNDQYSVLLQSQRVYPDFNKQNDRTYIPIDTCRYRRIKLDHGLTLKERERSLIKKFEKEAREAHENSFVDTDWKQAPVPFCVNKYPDKYQDGVLYRIKVFIPEKFRHKNLNLFFLGANYVVDVWVNERWVGSHEGGYTSFAFNISDLVEYGKENLIFIRLDNIPWLMDGFPNANEHDIVPYKQMDWWNYTGINRDVYIEVSGKISVARVDVHYRMTEPNKCKLNPYIVLNNFNKKDKNVRVKINIYEAYINNNNLLAVFHKDLADFNSVIYKGQEKKLLLKKDSYQVIPIDDIPVKKVGNIYSGKTLSGDLKFWHPLYPTLYILEVVLKDNNYNIIEKNYYQFGIRKAEIKNQKIFLNNVTSPFLFQGVSYHEEFYPDGRAIDLPNRSKILDNFKLIKDLNANFLRTAHYPQHPFTYTLADRMGIAIWEEIPVMWFDGPEFIFQLKNRKIPQQMLLETLYREYNSPSIIFNGLANECGWQDERRQYLWEMKNLGEKIRKGRIFAQSAVASDITDNTHRDMDVIGATFYFGVFYWDDPYAHTLLNLKKMNLFFPGKPIIATEFGIWSGEEWGNIEKQIEIAEKTYRAFMESHVMSGMVWWSLVDWFTIIGGYQTMGLVTMDHKKIKPVFLTLQKLYGKKIKNYAIETIGLLDNQRVRGNTLFQFKIKPEKNITSVQYAAGDLDFNPVDSKGGVYSVRINTTRLKEGESFFLARVKLDNNEVLYKKVDVLIDNYDEAPVVKANIQDNKVLMSKFKLRLNVKDDGEITRCQYNINDGPYMDLYKEKDIYSADIDLAQFKEKSRHRLGLLIKDDGKHTIKKEITFIYDNNPGIKVDLPYNLDRIAFGNNKQDCYFWGFPAEELPPSNSWVVCDGCNTKFFFPEKEDGKNNIMVSMGQYVMVKKGHYSTLNVFGYSYWGNQNNDLILYYDDGTQETRDLLLSEWTRNESEFGDHLAYSCSKHVETSGKEGDPAVSFYNAKISVDKRKELVAIEFPDDTHKHVIAASLEK